MIELIKTHLISNISEYMASIALLVSIMAYKASSKKNNDDLKYYTDREIHALLSSLLEKSYNELVFIDGNGENILTSSRMNWLTASRYLLRYKKLKKQIESELYKLVTDETERFWRDKFFLLIERIDSAEFFRPWRVIRGVDIDQELIYPASAAVILDFSQWDISKQDPLDDISFEQYVYENNLFSAKHRHFRDYIK